MFVQIQIEMYKYTIQKHIQEYFMFVQIHGFVQIEMYKYTIQKYLQDYFMFVQIQIEMYKYTIQKQHIQEYFSEVLAQKLLSKRSPLMNAEQRKTSSVADELSF